MNLLAILLVGAVIIGVTIIIHAFVCDIVLRIVNGHLRNYCMRFGRYWKIPVLVIAIYCICAALMFDIWLWAHLFLLLDPVNMATVSDALYYATSSFTTAGFADVEPSKQWRLFGAIAAMNGMILFGWSTAFIFEILAKLYDDDHMIKKRLGSKK